MVKIGLLPRLVDFLVRTAEIGGAAKQLGWDKIDCIEVADDPVEAELQENAENLHRLDLSKEQPDEHIRRYIELLGARREVSPHCGV